MKNAWTGFIAVAALWSTSAFGGSLDVPFPKSEKPPALQLMQYQALLTKDIARIYRIPGTAFEFADQNQSTYGAGFLHLMFGSLGSQGAEQQMQRDMAAKMETAAAFLPNLDRIAAAAASERFAGRVATARAAGAPVVELTPHGYLAANKEGMVRVSFYLDVVARNESGESVWRNGYFYSDQGRKPLAGPDGWLGEAGSPSRLLAESEQAFKLMMSQFELDMQDGGRVTQTELDIQKCLGGPARTAYLLRETASHWVVKRDGGFVTAPTTYVFSKETCKLGS
jgi:hypothetical protein